MDRVYDTQKRSGNADRIYDIQSISPTGFQATITTLIAPPTSAVSGRTVDSELDIFDSIDAPTCQVAASTGPTSGSAAHLLSLIPAPTCAVVAAGVVVGAFLGPVQGPTSQISCVLRITTIPGPTCQLRVGTPALETPAGTSSRPNRRRFVEINGEMIEVNSTAEAARLLAAHNKRLLAATGTPAAKPEKLSMTSRPKGFVPSNPEPKVDHAALKRQQEEDEIAMLLE